MSDDYLPPADRFAEAVAYLAAKVKKKPKAVASSMYALAIERVEQERAIARDATIMRDEARAALRAIVREVDTHTSADSYQWIRAIAMRALGEAD